ncbi:MAG: dihydroorotate dehydrogenase electron transfer subunit [Bacteroidota bacterium]
MQRFHLLGTIVRRQDFNEHAAVLGFQAPEIAASAHPGQFLEIKVSGVLWRRPMSIYRCEGDVVEILVAVMGAGSRSLFQSKIGEKLDVIGPLGNQFPVDKITEVDKLEMIIAGGVGIAPFPFLVERLQRQGRTPTIFVGARTKSQLLLGHLPTEQVHIATDDGSEGYKGNVVDLFTNFINAHSIDVRNIVVYACGPQGMLRSLQKVVRARRIQAWISIEREMACGLGICQGCAVRLADGGQRGLQNSSGEKDAPDVRYALACTDGPIFDATSIIL